MSSFLSADSQNGNDENKVEKGGMFLARKKHHTKHHNYHAFHHKLTTFLPSKKHRKIAKPPAKPLSFPPEYFFSKTRPDLIFLPSKPIGKNRDPACCLGSCITLPRT
jgi:hypothetical protein